MMRNVSQLWARAAGSAMLFGLLSATVRVGANVLLLPVVLSCLSEAEQALWWVYLALGAVATLADFGFGQAITRAYSYLWAGAGDFETEGLRAPQSATPNRAGIGRLNATARFLYWRLALGAALLLAVAGTWFVAHRTGGPLAFHAVWGSWASFLLVIFYSLGTSHWMLACQGINRVRDVQAALFLSGLAYVVVAAVLLWCGAGLFAMVIATGVRGFAARQMCRRSFRDAMPPVPDEPRVPDLDILRRLWPNVWKFGVLSAGTYLVMNVNVLISSRVLGDAATASYGLTAQVGSFLGNAAALWLTVKWPEITALRTQGRSTDMALLFARRLGLMLGTFAVLAGLLVLAGNAVLDLRGTNSRLLPTAPLLVYLVYVGQQQVYIQFANLKFTENVVPFYLVSLFTGVGMCFMTWFMSRAFGVWGLVLAPLLTTAACSSWYPVWKGFQSQPLTLRQFVCGAMGRLI